jgi:hypothetical protein
MFRFLRKNKNVSIAPVEAAPRGIHHTVSFAVSKDDSFAHIRREVKKMGQAAQLSR